MRNIYVGSLVRRRSHGSDLLFRVTHIFHDRNVALLRGVGVRLLADAPLDDLIAEGDNGAAGEEHQRPHLSVGAVRPLLQVVTQSAKPVWQKLSTWSLGRLEKQMGKVLHVDGDPYYLELSLASYGHAGIPAGGVALQEPLMPRHILALLEKTQPDILVLTGHDALRSGKNPEKLENYRHSRFFVEAVRRVRTAFEPHKDGLLIVAGACQSHYEEILTAGANYASSPKRVNIHALDPMLIAVRLAQAPVSMYVAPEEAISETKSGFSGLGGIESRGTMRRRT